MGSKMNAFLLHCWIIFPLVLVALDISVMLVTVLMTRQINHVMLDDTYDNVKLLLAHIHDRANLLTQANATVFHVSRVLSSIGDLSAFFNIADKVGPNLFLAFATMPWISQISYVGIHSGMLFSYYKDENQARMMFSNISDSSNSSAAHKWYSQSVDRDTGKVYGEVIPFSPRQNDFQWFQDAVNGKIRYASWGVGWDRGRDQMLFFSAPVAKSGVLSIGITMKDLADNISRVNLQGGHLYAGTEDGHVIVETGPPHTRYVLGNDTVSIHVMDQNDTLVVEKHDNVSCQLEGTGSDPSHTNYLSIGGKIYEFGCAHLDVSGIRMVYVISFPCKAVIPLIQETRIVVVSLLSLMILGLIVGSSIVMQLLRRSQIQEAFLRASLIKQKEAIQQAERKSMNKSLAFASASHDVRTSLAGITGLVELCRLDATPNSKLDRHLEQMNTCASQLLGIVNSVLDISKVEAGKMQLEEVEFDMAQVLEESADIFHVVALKKGLEVIWDPCDCSVLRCSNVKGDCRRLKQILDNLLGNAVKFTSEGHVVVRAWAKKPSLVNFELSSNHEFRFPSILSHLTRCLWKDEDHDTNMETLNRVRHDPDSVEFFFEVDDTGKGIPKEQRASVFENYVQVKESTTGGHEGTGLGLGIVQSYVRLMGGEISIKEKEPGEKGTCFRFNIFLKSSDTSLDSEDSANSQLHPRNSSVASTSTQLAAKNVTAQSKVRALTFKRGLQMEGIHSLLLVQGETKEIMQRWMESLGVKVWAVDHHKLLYPSLEKIKNNLCASAKPDSLSHSDSLARSTSLNGNKENVGCSSSGDVANQTLPLTTKELLKKSSSRGSSSYILIIIDLSSANMSEIYSVLKNFTSSIHNIHCKIVWVASSNTPAADLSSSNQEECDLLLQKPLHGSRLYALLKLLQEFGGTKEDDPQGIQITNTVQERQQSIELGSPMDSKKFLSNSFASQSSQHTNKTSGSRYNMDDDTPLSGMNILLAEDMPILSKVAKHTLSRLGATVEHAENGLDAVDLVTKALRVTSDKHNGTAQGDLKSLPYDVILMDCEMPIMNGYEATRKIREEEKYYGLHIPIIALTAHATPEEERKSISAGMDFHLTKPLRSNELLETINNAQQN